MAFEPEESISSLIQRLMTMPLLYGFTDTRSELDSDHDFEHHDRPHHVYPSLDRIILINPMTQGMAMIRRSATSFDSLLNDLTRMVSRRVSSIDRYHAETEDQSEQRSFSTLKALIYD
ncbi:hypothetical protein L6452_32221 [Arctium lappa]|uniref:Uncharacterized protein n=1 Tax=Arctium lappa TaxID=4217 RepID=A0ACB8Z3Y7_ARCLA|nr:hypothetical protein L6452_32221 [Arctium lappa]